jgi:hypothetical protein
VGTSNFIVISFVVSGVLLFASLAVLDNASITSVEVILVVVIFGAVAIDRDNVGGDADR